MTNPALPSEIRCCVAAPHHVGKLGIDAMTSDQALLAGERTEARGAQAERCCLGRTVLSRADGRPAATQTRVRCCGGRLGRCVAEGGSVAVSRTAQSWTDVWPVAPQTRAGAPCLGGRAPRQGRRRRSAVATRAKAGRPAGGGGGCPSHAPARVLGGGGGIGVKAGRPAGGGGCPSPNPDPRSPSSAVNG